MIIGGDFNARIYNVLEHERPNIGEFIITRPEGYVREHLSGSSEENGELFISCLKN